MITITVAALWRHPVADCVTPAVEFCNFTVQCNGVKQANLKKKCHVAMETLPVVSYQTVVFF